MFLLIDKNVIVSSNLFIMPLLNRIGFINAQQYYNFRRGRSKKFNHITKRFQIISINQNIFFKIICYGVLNFLIMKNIFKLFFLYPYTI